MQTFLIADLKNGNSREVRANGPDEALDLLAVETGLDTVGELAKLLGHKQEKIRNAVQVKPSPDQSNEDETESQGEGKPSKRFQKSNSQSPRFRNPFGLPRRTFFRLKRDGEGD